MFFHKEYNELSLWEVLFLLRTKKNQVLKSSPVVIFAGLVLS